MMLSSLSFTETNPTTSSSAEACLIPLTPAAVLPIDRIIPSLKRIAWPLLLAIRISLSPLVRRAPYSSSPSRIVMALIPFWRGLEKASNGVFFITPFFVHKRIKLLFTYSSSDRFFTFKNVFTLSSGGMPIRFCIALPREIFDPSGISNTLSQ